MARNGIGAGWLAAACCLALSASSAGALTPLLPCDVESGMKLGASLKLATTGLVFEGYENAPAPSRQGSAQMAAPVPALEGFSGVRVTHCASGRMVAIPGVTDVGEVARAMSAQPAMRDRVNRNRPISASSMNKAARAVYGKVIDLRETEETCGCHFAYPKLRPAGMTPWDRRKD